MNGNNKCYMKFKHESIEKKGLKNSTQNFNTAKNCCIDMVGTDAIATDSLEPMQLYRMFIECSCHACSPNTNVRQSPTND